MDSESVQQTVTGDHNVFTGTGDVHVHAAPAPLPPAEAQDRRNLATLLQRVQQFWIKDYLEKSLHTEALLELGKRAQVDAVAHPWERQIELPNQTREVIAPGKSIVDIFDDLNRAMLLLGEPGSGKTVT